MSVTLGPYDLQEVIGRGGMGVVHRALHRPTGAVRAVKVLDSAVDAESIERFRREAAALARAQGEGVAGVHDVGVANGRLYFGMPLFEGGSLQQRLARTGPLAWRDVVALGLSLARALERCHAVGLVHRDIKSANVLLDAQGRPHLADFGLVRDVGAARLTQTGTVLGTPSYMAPELFGASAADARADVYSLGVLLYELAAGHVPYRGAAAIQVLNLALAEKRAPLVGVPRPFEELIASTLAPDPARRLSSATDLVRRLEALLEAPGAPAARRGSLLAVALVLVLAVALALVASSFDERGGAPAPASTLPAPAPPQPTTTTDRDPTSEVRVALRRFSQSSDRQALRAALDLALSGAPPWSDPALAAAIISTTDAWREEDPVLASIVFTQAARLDPRAPQPEGLLNRLAIDMVPLLSTGREEEAADLAVGQARLGYLTLNTMEGVCEILERRVRAHPERWAERLALSRALWLLADQLQKGERLDEATARRKRGLEAATVDERGLPRAALALARLLQARHEHDLPGELDGRARLPDLVDLAHDVSCPGEVFNLAVDIALREKDLTAARPFIDAAGPYAAGTERVDDRPWAPPLTPYKDPGQLVRLQVMSRLLEGEPMSKELMLELDPEKWQGLVNRLNSFGRRQLAQEVSAFLER